MRNTTNYNELRNNLVNTIKEKGITDIEVLKAIGKVPRHLFIEKGEFSGEEAYRDAPLPIGEGQTISQPYTVAYQTQLLEVKKGEKILEIGTGSGYQTTVLAEIGAIIYTIERQQKLYNKTKLLLEKMDCKSVHMFYKDGNDGLPEFAPFDKILITAAATEIPQKLVQQLKTGGIMVLPLNGKIQRMTRVTKTSASEIKIEEFDNFRFVPLLQGTRE